MNTTETTAGPAWDAYLFALKSLELAEASYVAYSQRQLPQDAGVREVRHAGLLTTLAHNAVVNARRTVVEARRAYTLALELETEAQDCPVCGSQAVTIHRQGLADVFRPACGCEVGA